METHKEPGDTHGVETQMEWRSGDKYEDGTHPKRRHTLSEDIYGDGIHIEWEPT